MKRYFFSIIALALFAVTIVSCSKDDDKETTPEKTAVKYTCRMVIGIVEGQEDYFNYKFIYDLNGTKKTIFLSDMTDVTADSAKYYSSFYDEVKRMVNIYHVEGSSSTVKLYAYDCGEATKGNVSCTSYAPIKEDHPTGKPLTIVLGGTFYGVVNNVPYDVFNSETAIGATSTDGTSDENFLYGAVIGALYQTFKASWNESYQ